MSRIPLTTSHGGGSPLGSPRTAFLNVHSQGHLSPYRDSAARFSSSQGGNASLAVGSPRASALARDAAASLQYPTSASRPTSPSPDASGTGGTSTMDDNDGIQDNLDNTEDNTDATNGQDNNSNNHTSNIPIIAKREIGEDGKDVSADLIDSPRRGVRDAAQYRASPSAASWKGALGQHHRESSPWYNEATRSSPFASSAAREFPLDTDVSQPDGLAAIMAAAESQERSGGRDSPSRGTQEVH
ncbi:hypothetical protein L7F22_019349 [Adiantum nelumboides]|nr:hypothetical protein [Adiantum nelumboides]